MERLLEKSTREAFGDLLTLAASDKSLRILLTCRDYSTDLVRDCFLVSARVEHRVIEVPQLKGAELSEVEAAHPPLSRPLASPTLRGILRNPYFLDKAIQISWAPERPLPESEREFRTLFWQQIIRADQRMAGGMPRRREETFEEIALRRARALAVYVPSTGLDAAVVDSFHQDSLVVSPDNAPALVAPAHDVLEDWAILQWIDEQHAAHGGSFRELSAAIGPHPAVRRAYRKWVAELLDRDPGTADRLFQGAVADAEVPAQFRDDTLVSLLRAPSSAALLERHSGQLLANQQALFRRVIHLLRVACVTAPAWLPPAANHGSLFNVPEGPAWAAVLRLVQAHVEKFATKERLLLVGLIEDWARGVAYWAPYPDGAEAAAAIAFWLLPHFDTYRDESAGKRLLKVIAKIPLSARAQFEALLRGSDADEEDRTAEEFREVIFAGMDGTPAGRDLPDAVTAAAADCFLLQESDLEEENHYGSLIDLEPIFGIKQGLRHDYFPASAFRGPWISLLRSHPDKGIAFFLGVFNHSADWYAHPRTRDRVEPPFEIELTFADGTTKKQWANWRLWCWYRGTSVGPYSLQSLLMAFERWLLEYAKKYPAKLDNALANILRKSESVALTAVVASVATAFPHACGETLLVLLGSPICMRLDLERVGLESSVPSGLSEMLPTRAENEFYEAERKESDAQPPRQRHLEDAIMSLQLGPLAPRVQEILDRHRAGLPPVGEQTKKDKIWQIALHRIDLRQYKVSEVEVNDPTPAAEGAAPAPPRRLLRFDPTDHPEPDVKEMVETSAARLGVTNARLGLWVWARKVFKREHGASSDPAQWRQRLAEAQAPADADTDANGPEITSGPAIVAAVCLRDHWDEMSGEERAWCIERVCSEVMAHASEWDAMARIQRNDMAADRACAWVLPLVVGKALTNAQRPTVQAALTAAVTHAINQVRWYVTWGIAEHLWPADPSLAMRCVNAIAMEAALIEKERALRDKRRHDQRRQTDEIVSEAASVVRNLFWQPDAIPQNAYETLDVTDWFGADANARILTILSTVPDDRRAVAGFTRAAKTLVDWWDADDDRDKGRGRRDHDTESGISDRLQKFLMRPSPEAAKSILAPVLDAVDRHPREIHWIIQGLISVEDGQTNTAQFWFLWGLFADRVRAAKWLAHLNRDHPFGSEIVSSIFLGTYWKDHVRNWKSLKGYAHLVHKLFEDLPATAIVLDDYVRFLYHIGEESLPAAFVLIARRLQTGNSQEMLKKSNTVFLLEVLLLRNVYAKPLEL